MLDLLKDFCNCFLLSLVKKHLNEHIIYYNVSFLIEKSFRNLILFTAFEFIFILKKSFCLPTSITTFSEGLLTSLFLADFQY